MAASFDGHAEVAQILIEAGATTNTQKEVFKQYKHCLLMFYQSHYSKGWQDCSLYC